MGKSKHNNFHPEDRNYVDGYGLNIKKPKVNKSKEHRFERALKTKNVDDLLSLDEDSEYVYDDNPHYITEGRY